MEANCTLVPYQQTGYFSKIVLDYLNKSEQLKPFYLHTPTLEGIKDAIAARKNFATDRALLTQELAAQYKPLPETAAVQKNIALLAQPNTFTITTAHQPNIFTGPLYFTYKILHVIKLASELSKQFPESNFVPVFYMGSEDADLDELGSIKIDGRAYTWQTKQTGAVGRMKVDKAFLALLQEMEGQLGIYPFGKEIIQIFREAYKEGQTIQQSTLYAVNELFGQYGLVTVIPDNANLKRAFNGVVEKELSEAFSHKAVSKTLAALEAHYKVQAGGRDINLFYLLDDKRERIELANDVYEVKALRKQWSKEEIRKELAQHPERFSANVILRGVFQETILPNIAFIGGGGELAYWLELKDVFAAANVPYPVLILRNSFAVTNRTWLHKLEKTGLSLTDIFLNDHDVMNRIVQIHSTHKTHLNGELEKVKELYTIIGDRASVIDATLQQHVAALQTKTVKRLEELEKKMLRSERRKFSQEQQQLQNLKQALFPNNNLQERVENLSGFYAQYGRAFIDLLLQKSLTLEQEFAVLILE
ncbi:MAG: bacillithiol biosynthesis cysteine-adding enzyme BshC [Filimonas sp.]|nr:bacillithiol biosynthesis cysteine-adding enzyme BshC [Filimonas sp.]